ncbi:MAG: hypothetical protein J6O56_02065 [Bacilli bacterium]|nr:hypothetical protein [Bacilli bacterium]
MEKFSYYSELYYDEILDIDDMIKNKENVENAYKIEKYLSSLNDNVEIIRNAIVCSYRFSKVLKYEERLHHVRGILYSRQFINENDLLNYVNDLEKVDNRIFEKSLFDIRRFSDNYDKEFFENYMDNITVIDEEVDITEDYLQGKLNEIGEPISKTELVKEEEIELTVDEFFKDSYEVKDLLPKERIALFKKYYPLYKKGILEYKCINKDDNPVEFEYVSKGMDDYNQYITSSLEIMHNIIENDMKRKSKNMIFTI